MTDAGGEEATADGEHPLAVEVTVQVVWADGSEDKHRFFLRDDEPFPLVIDQQHGWPKAEHGPVTYTLPRWPSARHHRPAPPDTDSPPSPAT